ncbi:helix-turn-helix domain-containing protein [Sulfobacillus harzensis]|uniref:Helix-turn-helix transcriptional regulator n=1 Tax=Sulfobacillus harzensis TaxID=2729629 RepID=A0A7Y0L7T4_9FIRM|nr:helix-turn-helix transcriptional regulator [Sulfobacillus harzensis]NMP24790.1 helix-turn-helix transcriptional regulator [Sulfobacillus harzensis]
MFLRMRSLPAPYWLVGLTILLFGWIEAFIVEILRITPGPLDLRADALVLVGLAAMFSLTGLTLKFSWVGRVRRWFAILALPWVAALSLLGWATGSPLGWALVETGAVLPLAFQWLSYLPVALSHRNRTFLTAWIGATAIAGILIFLVHLFPLHGGAVFASSLMVMAAMLWVLPTAPAWKPSLRPIRPNQTGGAAIGLYLALGLGGSTAARWASSAVQISWIPALLLTVASLIVLLALPFAFKRTRHMLAYLSAVFLAIDLLGFADPGVRNVLLGLQFLLLVAANLLSLWWSISLITALRRAPAELGIALGATSLAVALGWFLPAATGKPAIWMLVAVILVVMATPFLMASSRAPEPTSSTFRGNPEYLFDRAKLTPQERRIVQLLLQGKSNQAIIQELYVSINTLKTHLKNIYRKTETKNRHELIDLIGSQQNQSAGH